MKPLRSSPTKQIPQSYVELLLCQKKFTFQSRKGQLNLRDITQLDVDRIANEVDIDSLQRVLENIIFSEISHEDLHLYSDDCFINLFRIAQLILEYLLSVQDVLASNLNSLAKKYAGKKRDLEIMRKTLEHNEEELAQMKRKMRMNDQNIASMEAMMNFPLQQQNHKFLQSEFIQSPISCKRDMFQPKISMSLTNQNNQNHTETVPVFHLYIVRWQEGKCTDLNVPSNWTIRHLKEELFRISVSKAPVSQQHISFKGNTLSDNSVIQSCFITDKSVLILMDSINQSVR